MTKKAKLIVVFIIVLILSFAITFSFKNDFFTLQYYNTPLAAYNSNCTHDIVIGNTEANKQLGIKYLDTENCLFIGELDSRHFVVAELSTKNGKYAFKGTSIIYDITDSDDAKVKNQTNVLSGSVSWSIIYNENILDSLLAVNSVDDYELTNGNKIYLVVYTQ